MESADATKKDRGIFRDTAKPLRLECRADCRKKDMGAHGQVFPVLEQLEPRVLLSGENIASLPGFVLPDLDRGVATSINHVGWDDPAERLLIVDRDAGAESLVASAGPGTSIHWLDNSSDGLSQVTQILSNHQGVEQLIILSHGAEGRIDLGGSQVGTEHLREASQDIRLWQQHLADDATILLLGCNVASGATGE